MPALTLTLCSFAIILLLSRLKAPLWAAISTGTIALGLFFGATPLEIARVAFTGATRSTSIGLLLVMALLMAFSESLRQTGRLEKVVESVNAFFRRPAITLAALPALIGLLPMPGGALFSAPMVRQAAGEKPPDGNLLSALNYWWRHIWEHWWPMYPGVILAMTLTSSSLMEFIAYQFPLCLGMALTGLLIVRSLHPDMHRVLPPAPPGTFRRLVTAIAPIGCVLVLWFAADFGIKTGARLQPVRFQALSPGLQQLATKFAPLLLGLVGSLVVTLVPSRLPFRKVIRLFGGKETLPLLGLVLSVMIYQQMLTHVNAAQRIGQELTDRNVPLTSVVIALPFIAGMLTGIAFGFVGVSFPIVLSLVAGIPDTPMRPYVVLAYASGHIGMMLSPIHLCYVVSNRYFGASFGSTYRYIGLPSLLMALLAGAYFLILRWTL